jgi:hypothetical protein
MRTMMLGMMAFTLFVSGANSKAPQVRKTFAGVPSSGGWRDFSATADLNGSVAQCPAGSFVTGIQGFKSDRQSAPGQHIAADYISELRFGCFNAAGDAVGVRKTFEHVPDGGSWSEFSGTANMNGSLARCPVGSFVSGIEALKAARQIRPGPIRTTAPDDYISELRLPLC